MLGDILAKHVELNESLIDDAATDTAQDKIARLRKQTDDARQRLQKLRQAQKRRRDLEKLRANHEHECERQTESKGTQRTIQLLDGHGRLIEGS